MLDPQEIYLQSADPKTERIAHIYEEYRKELRKANAMDFDDLLLEAMRLLKVARACARILQPEISVSCWSTNTRTRTSTGRIRC